MKAEGDSTTNEGIQANLTWEGNYSTPDLTGQINMPKMTLTFNKANSLNMIPVSGSGESFDGISKIEGLYDP